MSHDVFGFQLGLGPLQDRGYRHPLPAVAATTPPGDAVDVRHDLFGGHRAQLAVIESQLVLDCSENSEVPLRDVGLGNRAKVEKGPFIGGGERLAGWNARRIDTVRQRFLLEEGRHLASIGSDTERARSASWPRVYWTFQPECQVTWARGAAGSALESHSRGQGFESPRVHQCPVSRHSGHPRLPHLDTLASTPTPGVRPVCRTGGMAGHRSTLLPHASI